MRDTQDAVQTRRSFLTGGPRRPRTNLVIRPPWSDNHSILEDCTSCGDCINACPENILHADEKGKPELKFDVGGCSFCMACANACDEGVFDLTQKPALPWIAKISDPCLLRSGVSCQICTDACEVEALSFNMREKPVGAIELDTNTCTGCGTCIAPCPTSAIILVEHTQQVSA